MEVFSYFSDQLISMEMNNSSISARVAGHQHIEKEENKIEWLPEDEACELLGIKKKTIQNYISSGRIPSSFYLKNIDGKRFYNKNKLLVL